MNISLQNNSEVEMYSYNWYYTEPPFKILLKDFAMIYQLEYANLCILCSYTVVGHANTVVGRQEAKSYLT